MRGAITLPNGEWDALEILGKLSASPCPIPRDWIDNIHYLDYSAWNEYAYVTFPTMLRLCTHLPLVRTLVARSPRLPAPIVDCSELVSAIRTSGAFRNVEQFELRVGGGRGAITTAFALLESMCKLRELTWDVGDYIDWKQRELFFSQQDAEHALVVDQLDLSHLRLRSYDCSNLCVGCELPLVHSGETLEYLGLYVASYTSRREVVRVLVSVLRSTPFVRLRVLRLHIYEGATPYAAETRDDMLSTLSNFRYLRRLSLCCIIPDLGATLALLTAPLCGLRIATATAIPIDTGIKIIHDLLNTSPALRSLRHLIIDAEESSFLCPVQPDALPLFVEQLGRTCMQRRVRLTYVDNTPRYIQDPW